MMGIKSSVDRHVILKVDPGSEHVTCTCKSIDVRRTVVDHWIHVDESSLAEAISIQKKQQSYTKFEARSRTW